MDKEARRETARQILRHIGYGHAIICCNAKDWDDYVKYYAKGRCVTPIKDIDKFNLIREFYYSANELIIEKDL